MPVKKINIYNNKKNYRKEAYGREKEKGEYIKWGFLHLKNSNTNGKSWMDYEKYVCFFCHLAFFTCNFLVCLSETALFVTSLTNMNVDIRQDRLSFAGCTLQAIRCTILSSRQIKLPLNNGNPRPITSASTVSHVGRAISSSPSKEPKNAVSAIVSITYV